MSEVNQTLKSPLTIVMITVKCDTSGCDYTYDIELKDLPRWLNARCPFCQEVMVTKHDVDQMNLARITIAIFNFYKMPQLWWANFKRRLNGLPPMTFEDATSATFQLNEDGEYRFKDTPPPLTSPLE